MFTTCLLLRGQNASIFSNSREGIFPFLADKCIFWLKRLIREKLNNCKTINTQLYKKESTTEGDSTNTIGGRLFRIFNRDSVRFYGTLVIISAVFFLRGSSGEGQATFFSDFLKTTIEETSASISSYIPSSHSQLAEINTLSLAELDKQNRGQGGAEIQPPNLEPSEIQGNSFLSYNPASTDYLEHSSIRRSQVVEYTVQPGDVISFIASDYGVSVDSIIWANGLKSADSLSPGQVLRIPPVTGVIHKVKNGETIAQIAQKYGVGTDKIIEYNALPQDGQLQIDDEIIIPDGKIAKPVVVAVARKVSSGTTIQRFSYLPDYGGYFMIPTTGHNWGKIHGRNGVDIANSCGTPIYASADGTVKVSDAVGYNGGFGKFITIAHPNGTETVYAHATKLLASVGQVVAKGQHIANMGTTGRSTGCHLHFEVHGGKNPLAK